MLNFSRIVYTPIFTWLIIILSQDNMGLLLTIPIVLTIVFLISYLYQKFRYKLPPGPTPRPIVGNLFHVHPVQFRCFHEWAQKYGPIISVKMGSLLNVVVSNAELAKQVLKEHDQNLADRYRATFGIFSRGGKDLIWADYGPHFVKVKKLSSLHLFSQKSVDALRHIREDEVTSMIDQIFHDCTNSDNQSQPLKIRDYLGTLSLNHITRLTFGKRVVNSKGEYFDDPSSKLLQGMLTRRPKKMVTKTKLVADYVPWLWWLNSASNDKGATDMYNAKLDEFVKGVMEEYAQAKSKDVTCSKQHFVDALLTYKDEYDLSEDTVISLLWDMVIAGIDTISITVEWALAELIRNPRVQKKAQEELDRVIGHERIMTEEDIANLPYLQALAKESLRLHPPTPLMLPHMAKQHVKIAGYDIPKGAVVYVNVWALGRDPEVWHDPNEFRPERFFEENIDMKGHDFRLLPFGAGRRVCPGAQMGINLVTSVLGHLLHQFNWNLPHGVKGEEINMSETPGHVTYMASPLEATAKPRLSLNLYKNLLNEK